jgi:hypothetical protein
MGASEEEIAAGIAAAGLDPKQRPETLGIEEFAALAESVAEAIESAAPREDYPGTSSGPTRASGG